MNRSLLKKHFEDHPLMQPIDAVKLAYQHAFGCGHLMPRMADAQRMIQQEMDSIPEDASISVSESIGGGLCRLNLAAPRVRKLGAKWIARMMRATEMEVLHRRGNELIYTGALMDVEWAVANGLTAFSNQEWKDFLDWHRDQGRPVVSHSDVYRQTYAPHYRVVLENFIDLLPVIEKLRDGRNLIVIDGPCGSGKSTLGRALAGMEWHEPLMMDDFFLPFDKRTEERLAQPGGNVDYERFREEILLHLDDGLITYDRYDCATGTLVQKRTRVEEVGVIEGSYSHHPAFDDIYRDRNALRVYVDVDAEEQLRRIARRNPDMADRFREVWIPLEKRYFEAYDIKDRADVIVKCTSPLREGDE